MQDGSTVTKKRKELTVKEEKATEAVAQEDELRDDVLDEESDSKAGTSLLSKTRPVKKVKLLREAEDEDDEFNEESRRQMGSLGAKKQKIFRAADNMA